MKRGTLLGMRLAAFLFLAASLPAQTLNLSVSPATVRPGGSSVLTVTWTDAVPTMNAAGLQWSLSSPSGVTAGAGAVGTAGVGKILSCNPPLCLLVGSGTTPNATAIASGPAATFPLSVPAGTPAGALALSLAGIFATDTGGLNIPLTTTGATLTVLSRYDLNSDGKVDGADIQLALAQALGQSGACAIGDVNGDGKCNVHDVVLVILAAMGRIPL